MTVRVLVCDDHQLVRTGFQLILDADPRLAVVGQAADGLQAVALAARLRPDVVLMDVRMPGLDGIAATRALAGADAAEPVRVLILTAHDLDEYVYDALRAGATGFLLKDAPPAALVHAVLVVASGQALLDPAATRRLIRTFAAAAPPPPAAARRLAVLTAREREVAALVARGLANGEIARLLGVGEETVRTHVARTLAKLGLRGRVQLVVAGYETGLVRPRAGHPRGGGGNRPRG